MIRFLILALLCALPLEAQVRVNLGGPAYTDSNGNAWAADNGCTGGAQYTQPGSAVANTKDQTLFDSIRYATQGQSFTCTYAVPNGAYTVNLSFAELWQTARSINVLLNGTLVLSAFNVSAKVGFNTADVESFQATVTNGSIAIEMDSLGVNGYMDAIEILPNGPPQTLPFKFTLPGSGGGLGFTVTVPGGTSIPSCSISDGNCSLILEITDCNGNAVTAITPGCAVTLSIFKSWNEPTNQTQTTILANVTSP